MHHIQMGWNSDKLGLVRGADAFGVRPPGTRPASNEGDLRRAVDESDCLLRLAVKASQMGLWSWDVSTGEVFWNEQLHRITGHDEPCTCEDYLRLVHPGDQGRIVEWRRLFDDSAPALEAHRILRPDGDVRWVRALGDVTRDANGNVRCYHIGVLDITESTRTWLQLMQAQKVDALGNLTPGITHHFNNMLGVIVPAIETCLPHTSSEVRPLLEEAFGSAERAAQLVAELMVFSGRRQEQARTVTDLAQLLRRVVSICEKTFERNLTWELRTTPDVPAVLCDVAAMEQVFLNLILNARDAIAEAPRAGRITVSVSTAPRAQGPADGRWVRVIVEDNGVGLGPSDSTTLFQPLFTTKRPLKATGLGLATSQRTISDHGGSLCFESQEDQGTTYEVLLPATDRLDEVLTAPLSEARSWDQEGLVMMIDDEPGVRHVVQAVMRATGIDVIEAESAHQALRILREGIRPDLVLLDRSMPGMSAARAATAIRRLLPGSPILFFTGQEVPSEDSALVDGALQKPLNLRDLRRAISYWLDRGRSAGP